MKEVRLYNGQKIKLSGQSVQEYIAWRKRFINVVDHVIATKFPELYGNIQFNIQGGKFVNANMGDSIYGTPITEEMNELLKCFDELTRQ